MYTKNTIQSQAEVDDANIQVDDRGNSKTPGRARTLEPDGAIQVDTRAPDSHWPANFIRAWTVESLCQIAQDVETPDPGYRALSAAQDLLAVVARLVAYDAVKTRRGAPVAEFGTMVATVQGRLGEAMWRRLPGGWPDQLTREAA